MKIISGGQTGIDKLGLVIAKDLGLETGGTAPKGYKTEDGPDLSLRDEYNLKEHSSSAYPPRTKCNIKDSDCTLIFGDTGEPGTKLTVQLCKDERKPYLINPTSSEIIELRNRIDAQIINIAGNRASKLNADIILYVAMTLRNGLSFPISKTTLF
jgi:hypothetical protein